MLMQIVEYGELLVVVVFVVSGILGVLGVYVVLVVGVSVVILGFVMSGVKFVVLLFGDLQYDMFYNGMQNMIGMIYWCIDGYIYDLLVLMLVLFVGLFIYCSEGCIDVFGVVFDCYVEKCGKWLEDIVIFNCEIWQVVFMCMLNNVLLLDGVQDCFSMLMQLLGFVCGNFVVYKLGVMQQFFVIDNNSGEIWLIIVIGDEQVQMQVGIVVVWYFMCLLCCDGDMCCIDMWFVLLFGWLFVWFVQSELNGVQIELLWYGWFVVLNVFVDVVFSGVMNVFVVVLVFDVLVVLFVEFVLFVVV